MLRDKRSTSTTSSNELQPEIYMKINELQHEIYMKINDLQYEIYMKTNELQHEIYKTDNVNCSYQFHIYRQHVCKTFIYINVYFI